MSGVNRNILLNNSQAVMGVNSPTEVNLVTTSGSRWVIMDFLNTAPTSSNGLCQDVVLEWSPDPSMITNPYQPSSSYYAVTSSVFSCQSASLSPQTGSEAWVQFIDSYWLKTPMTPAGIPTTYYLRAYQNRINSPIAIYSPAMSVETRPESYCGENYTSSLIVPYIVADMDSYYSPGFSNKWMNDVGDEIGPNQSASFSSGAPDTSGSSWYLVKAGGPNNDGLRSDGSNTVSWPQLIISGSGPIRCGVGIVRGRAEWTATSNGLDFLIRVQADETPTTSSITVTKVSTGEIVGQIDPLFLPTNLQNTYVELILDKSNTPNSSEIRVDNNTVGRFNLGFYGAATSITLKDNFKMTVYGTGTGYLPNTGIIRVITAQMPYNPTVYHCKYGPVGASSYVE